MDAGWLAAYVPQRGDNRTVLTLESEPLGAIDQWFQVGVNNGGLSPRSFDVELLAGATAHELTRLAGLRANPDEETAHKALAAMRIEGTKLETYLSHIGTDNLVTAMGQAATDRAFTLLRARGVAGFAVFVFRAALPDALFRFRPPRSGAGSAGASPAGASTTAQTPPSCRAMPTMSVR